MHHSATFIGRASSTAILKPSNIFIRPDGRPVLVDFGLMSNARGMLGREALDAVGRTLGTASYVSPEQIRGEFVDARADLYALGCMLYESLAGRPPFLALSTKPILTQHLHETPPPISDLVEGVPLRLEELIERLLAKNPRERIGYADDVAQLLAEVEGAVLSSRVPMLPAEPIAYLYRPRIAGRGDVLEKVARSRAQATRGEGALLFLGGPSGIGKTFVAAEAARQAAIHGFTVVMGECLPLGGPDDAGSDLASGPLRPLRPLLQAMADRCQEEGAAYTDRIFGPRGKLLAAYEPSLTELPGQADYDDPISISPQVARRRFLDALQVSLAAFADERPILLVLDDIQWIDELSLAFLQSLTPQYLQNRSLLVLGTFRSDEVDESLHALLTAPGSQTIYLDGLDRATLLSVAADMLAVERPPQPLAEMAARRAEGNPFFLAEYLRAAAVEGMLHRVAGRWESGSDPSRPAGRQADRLPLPHSLRELIYRRLEGLTGDVRTVLESAAVLGREFSVDALLATAGLTEERAVVPLGTLRLRQILEQGEKADLRFVHDKLREIAYERTPLAQRRELHRRAATALEAQNAGAQDMKALYPTLARHWSVAGVPERAYQCFVDAGAVARASSANEEAIAAYEGAQTEAEAARARAGDGAAAWLRHLDDLREVIGDLAALLGRHERARASYDAVLASTTTAPITRARILRKVGKTLDTHHHHSEALQAYAAARSILESKEMLETPPAHYWREWIQLQLDRIWCHYWTGEMDAMQALVDRVTAELVQHGSPAERAGFYESLALVHMRRERYRVSPSTVEYARKALAASTESGEAGQVANVRFVFAFALLFHGALDEAERHMLDATRAAERMGDVALQSRSLAYVTLLARKSGRLAEARQAAERTMAVASAGRMTDYLGAAEANLAWVAWREGRQTEATVHADRAVEYWAQTPTSYPFQWMARWPLLAIAWEQGHVRQAIGQAAAMLDPSQQQLEDDIAAVLQTVADLADPTSASAGEAVSAAVEAAKHAHYL